MKTYINLYRNHSLRNQSNARIATNGDFYFKVKHYDINNNYTHYTWKTIPSLNMYSLYV